MNEFEGIIKEVLFLSDVIRNQDFRPCFITHFESKVRELGDVSSKIDARILGKLQLKLLDSLLYHLRSTKSSNDKIVLINCIQEVLKITSVHSVGEFYEVYTVVFFQIFKNADLPYKPSEELQECVLECCSFLIRNSTEKVLEKVYSDEFSAKFSLGISISVGIVKEERSVKLRMAALNFLLTASKFEDHSNYTISTYNKIGDLFMLYLPGILAPLLEVVLRDETQQHSITCKALTCLGHILSLVMRDSGEGEKLSHEEIIEQWLTNQTGNQNKVINVQKGLKEKKRTKLWLESAAVTLHPLIERLSDLRKHSHSKVRLELTLVMVKLLKNCKINLKNCLCIIIEVLVTLTLDEDEEVCKVAKEALGELESECDKKSIDIFVHVIEENLFFLIKKLPRVLKSENEQSSLLLLKSLSGYLRILGRQNRLRHLMSFSSTLRKLISVIKISFELELYPEISTQDFSVWENEVDSPYWSKPWKQFRHFTNPSSKNQLEEICRILGGSCQSETILDFLLAMFNDEHSFRKEILLIINEVILGVAEIEDHTINQLLEFFLKQENLDLPLRVNNTNCTSLREAQTNIIQVTLIMEGIGHLAKKIGIRFQKYLLKSLYYVLQQMGSSFSLIKEAASKSAVEIANACGLKGNVRSLVQSNVDYLAYHLTVNLRRNDDSVFDVITVLIKNSHFQAVHNLEEIINSVLASSSKNFDSPQTLSYLRVFQIFVVSVRRWMEKDVEQPASKVRIAESGMDRLVKYLEETKGTKSPDEEDVEKPEGEEEDVEETSGDERFSKNPEKPKLPEHLKITLAVGNHCLNFLATTDKDRKIIVLEILNECVLALADWEDDLLPLVHNIWSPLTTKFESLTDPLVIHRSFKLLCTLSFTSKDFVRARTLKNVLPALESFLRKQSTRSRLKDSASGYFFTQNFKLQRELLSSLGKLTRSLGLFEKQTDLAVESALPYLSVYQPRELQESCRIFFEDVKSYDRELVWYKLHVFAVNSEFGKNAKSILSSIK